MMLYKRCLYQWNVPNTPCQVINHCVLTWHVRWECMVWHNRKTVMLASTWAVAKTDTSWPVCRGMPDMCVVFSQCGDHMSVIYSNVHKLHLWWPVYATWSFQSNSSLQRTHHVMWLHASFYQDGAVLASRLIRLVKKTHYIYITSRKLQKLLEWSEHQDHDHQLDETNVK